MLIPADDGARLLGAPCASSTADFAFYIFLDRVTELAGENVELKRDLTERDARIATLKGQLRASFEQVVGQADPCVHRLLGPIMVYRVPRLSF